MATYERVRAFPLEVESYALEPHTLEVAGGFTRVTTVVRLRGRGEEGVGEDVTYEEVEHARFLERLGHPALPLSGSWRSFDEFSRALGQLELFPSPPEHDAWRNYRRWSIESAALDLALRQAQVSLADALEREPRPVAFVVSMRLGEPPSLAALRRWLDLYPRLRFKLDPTPGWNAALVEELARTRAVDCVDLKGAYRGTVVDNPADARLYRLVAEGFPDAWIEDPDLGDAAAADVLAPHRPRITWDAPIHSVDDIEALPFPPRMLNVKPSRFGTVAALFHAYDYCASRGIGTYGGGQFELGPGRGQIQYLASLFHPQAPNDVAPGGFNRPQATAGLPSSPLEPRPAPSGFRWGENGTVL